MSVSVALGVALIIAALIAFGAFLYACDGWYAVIQIYGLTLLLMAFCSLTSWLLAGAPR